jgi:hypothetical protein
VKHAAFRAGADLVLLSHFIFAATAVFGGFGLLALPWWTWVHAPTVIWSSAINFIGWTCPLTPLEKRLRVAGGCAGYQGGFIHHYFGPLVYPKGMPRKLELTAGVAVLIWNAIVYTIVLLIGPA